MPNALVAAQSTMPSIATPCLPLQTTFESVARAHLLAAASMPAEPHIRSPFYRAASTTIPHSGGHRAREGGSTLYFGILQPLFVTVRPPGSNAADQASWNSR